MSKEKHQTFERLLSAAREVNAEISGPQKLADALNESAQTVTNWGTRGVSAKAAAKAQSLLGVSSTYILEGTGPRFVRAALSDDLTEVLPATEPRDLIRIPLLANSGSMGKGNDTLDADYVVGDLALSAHWINQHIKPGNIRELKFIHAQGESMSPTFSDGDVLLVDVGSRDPASHEGVYVLDVHGQTYIKRVRMRMSGTLEVSSDNPNIKTVDELNGDHQVRVLGRVVWAWNGQKL
ncbi:S24 family peptidase [Comamonas thiooxydans]|uniref:S24 family peptidase n=1 Tax=Comamonas thiooxydans TaxID=363952 RepID=UPI000B4159B2|nr:S24 family peptidase [Comamonas thiooxydans]BDB69106.1 hypothetical protein Cthiooxydans_15180 [Comamonas thiooxydans]